MASAAPHETSAQVVNATVSANNSYELVLDKWENAQISKQASHSQVSTAGVDAKSGLLVYRYTPLADFKGTDEVALSTSKKVNVANSSDCNFGNNENITHNTTYINSYITVKIKVN